MGNCKICDAVTPGTKDICEKCEQLREKSNYDETYLDGLLSSVMNSEPVHSDGLERNEKPESEQPRGNENEYQTLSVKEYSGDGLKVDEVDMKSLDNENLNMDSLDTDDLDIDGFDFDESNFDNIDLDALEEMDLEDFYQSDKSSLDLESDYEDLDKLSINEDLKEYDSAQEEQDIEDDISADNLMDFMDNLTATAEEPSYDEISAENDMESSAEQELNMENEELDIPIPDLDSFMIDDDKEAELADKMDFDKDNNVDTNSGEMLDPAELFGSADDDGGGGDPELLNLLDMLDMDEDNNSASDEEPSKSNSAQDASGTEDLFSLDELFGSGEESEDSDGMINDSEDYGSADSSGDSLGDIFSDVLGAVSSLDDEDLDNDLSNIIPDAPDLKLDKKSKKAKKEKKEKGGLFKKLFSNVPEDEETIERRKKEEEELVLKNEQKAKNKKEEAEKKAAAKEEKKKADAEKKAAKPKKEKKPPKPKKEKKKPEETEEDLNPGRINRVGATLVLSFFLIVAIGILSVTDLFSYSTTIANATKFFDRQKYTQAYNEIIGVKIRPEDQELADKIKTVSYVNKQLNSYNNYYRMGRYPEALDSLIKGLERYEKHIEAAQLLGIVSDLDYVKGQILGELKDTYGLSENSALELTGIEDKEEYSEVIYSVASAVEED